MVATNNMSIQYKKDYINTFSQNFEKKRSLGMLPSRPKKKSLKYKVKTIVNRYNSFFEEIHLNLCRYKYADEAAYHTRLLRAKIRKQRGEAYFKEKERRLRKTLDYMHRSALQTNAQKKQVLIGGYSLEIQMADKLNSLIEDWNVYLTKNPKFRLNVEENKRVGRHKQ
jgi:hypothetical protein